MGESKISKRKILFILSILTILTTMNFTIATNNTTTKNTINEAKELVYKSSITESTAKTNTYNNYTISYFDKKVGGNVLKNYKVKKTMPKTKLSKKIVSMSKKGSVILKFGNGKGPKILLTAGIHGNEVAANIATLKIIETLKKKKIKGTIYVIPFAIPKDTAINSRSWYFSKRKSWVDPNRVSHISGTPGNKIVKFAKKNKIKYIVDIHTGGGLFSSKNGFIFANSKPATKTERNWLKYIRKNVNPSVSYNSGLSGFIRRHSRSEGISTLTFEVERDHGSVSYWAKIEYKMLFYACKYFKFF